MPPEVLIVGAGIGCHNVDLVAFITGLVPAAVSVYGILDRFPNGNPGYLWTDARVVWNNGACLNVQNALGLPDAAPGATLYAEPSPDYFQYVDVGGPGLVPVGYGYRSIAHIVAAVNGVNAGSHSLEDIDAAGLIATPASSGPNEWVIEAARASLRQGGR